MVTENSNVITETLNFLFHSTAGSIHLGTSPSGVEYLFDTEYVKIEIARKSCRSKGFVLAKPRTVDEVNFFLEQLSKVLKFTWIDGISPNPNSEYYSEDGTVFPLLNPFRWVDGYYKRCAVDPCGIMLYPVYGLESTISNVVSAQILCQRDPIQSSTEAELQTQNTNYITNETFYAHLSQLEERIARLEKAQQLFVNRSDTHEYSLNISLANTLDIHISGRPTLMGFRVSLMKNNVDDVIAFQLSVDFSRRIV